MVFTIVSDGCDKSDNMQDEVIDYGVAEIQSILLEVLDELDSICRKNDIHYSLHGGTLLGAERNHHLIPWDDDIDISMIRDEYEKFRKVAVKCSGKYYLDEETMWFPRFVMKSNNNLAYIDILIWDFISEKPLEQKLKITLLRALQGMMKTHIEYEKFGLGNKFLLWSTHTFGKLFSNKKKQELFYSVQMMFQGKKLFIHRSNDAFRGVSYIFDSNYMSEYIQIELEGKQYEVTSRYHEFLIRNYGPDYLTPPPMSERKPEHTLFRTDLYKENL